MDLQTQGMILRTQQLVYWAAVEGLELSARVSRPAQTKFLESNSSSFDYWREQTGPKVGQNYRRRGIVTRTMVYLLRQICLEWPSIISIYSAYFLLLCVHIMQIWLHIFCSTTHGRAYFVHIFCSIYYKYLAYFCKLHILFIYSAYSAISICIICVHFVPITRYI